MTRKITEAEFIELYSQDCYVQLAAKCFDWISRTPEFKNSEPSVYNFMVWDWETDGKPGSITVECTANKIFLNGKVKAVDFGIVGLILSDEPMPDESLDRFNEVKKQITGFTTTGEK